VLTIPAAGSELSDSAVLTNESLGVKMGLSSPLNRPALAVMNPALGLTLPRRQIACGVSDILMHTLDRYFTHTKGNETTDALAEAVLRTTLCNGLRVLSKQEESTGRAAKSALDAMSELFWCSSLSHCGLTGLGAVTDFAPHKLGHELSARWDVPHGASLTAVWGSWARYAMPEGPERFARFAREVFAIQESDPEKSARRGIEAQEEYFRRIGMPTSLRELDVNAADADLQAMARQATAAGPVANFKKLGYEDCLAIYRAAMG